jgi:RNA polymerase sigma-70 factor, ECF subfamily
MKSIAFNHLGNVSDAEDAVQETFLKIHRSASGFQGGSAFSTWIYRILINTCYDTLRRRKVRPDESALDAILGRTEESEAPRDTTLALSLRKVIDQLSAPRRSVFILYEVEGLSHRDIGGILGIRESYSKWLLFMAKQDLREMWTASRSGSSS